MAVRFYKETNFKDTEIGRIPKDWEVRRLGEYLIDFVRGVNYKQFEAQSEKKDGLIPLLRATNLQDGKVIFQDMVYVPAKKVKQKQLIKKGDIIVTTSSGSKNLVGRAIYIKEEVKEQITIGAFLAILRFGNINLDFVNFLIESELYRKYLNNLASGTNINNLKKEHIFNFPIPLPPLPEQKAIAKVLSDFDELIDVIDRKIETLQRIKKGLMDIYFTRGVFEHKEFIYREELGQEIPKDWEVKRLGEICNISSGGTPSRQRQEYWENGTIPWIKSESCQNSFIWEADEFITEQGFKNSSAKLLPKDTVLIAMVGATLGKVGYLMFPASTNQNVAGLIVKDSAKLSPLFLFYCLQSRYEEFTKGRGYKIANLSYIRAFHIPLPPLSEQKAIAERLKAIDDQIENLRGQREHLEKIKKKFMELLLTGQVRIRSDEV